MKFDQAYYEMREKKNNELVECYLWLIVLTLILGSIVGTIMLIIKCVGKLFL